MAQTGGYDVIDLNEISYRAVTPANIYITQTYNAIYNTVYTANKIINNIDAVPFLDAGEHDNTLAEALFVRALADFDLLRFWGEHWDRSSPFGVSIVNNTDVPKEPVARSSVEESYQQIFTDLEKALGLFNSDAVGTQYATSLSAKALLAKFTCTTVIKSRPLLTQPEVIESGSFELLGPDDFHKIYTTKLSSESIFELVFDPQNNSAYNASTYLRDDALRSDVIFLASADLNNFSKAGRVTGVQTLLIL